MFLIDRDLDNKYWSRKSFDLCPNCMRKLEVFIKNEEEQHDFVKGGETDGNENAD